MGMRRWRGCTGMRVVVCEWDVKLVVQRATNTRIPNGISSPRSHPPPPRRHVLRCCANGISSPRRGNSKSAQGNTLGIGNPQNVALKGRPFFGGPFGPPFQGSLLMTFKTQGVALGYHRIAPSGRQSAGARDAVPSVSGKFKYGKSFQDSTTGAGCSRHLGSRHLDVAPSGRHSGSFAPTAHSKSAQGNALGTGEPTKCSPEGAA